MSNRKNNLNAKRSARRRLASRKGAVNSSRANRQRMLAMRRNRVPRGGAGMLVEYGAPINRAGNSVYTRPTITNEQNGSVLIEHTEYISDIGSSSSFANTVLYINPGLSGVFPWLSTIAAGFESYSFVDIEFLYRTRSPATREGTLILAVDYDASDDAYTTKQQAMAGPHADAVPWQSMTYKLDHRNTHKLKQRYVRMADLTDNQDYKLYDTGIFQVITQGTAGVTVNLGELHVRYKVRLMTPTMHDAASNGVLNSQSQLGLTPSNTNVFGVSGQTQYITKVADWVNAGASDGRVEFPENGQWLVDSNWSGAAMTLTGFATSIVGGSILRAVYASDSVAATKRLLSSVAVLMSTIQSQAFRYLKYAPTFTVDGVNYSGWATPFKYTLAMAKYMEAQNASHDFHGFPIIEEGTRKYKLDIDYKQALKLYNQIMKKGITKFIEDEDASIDRSLMKQELGLKMNCEPDDSSDSCSTCGKHYSACPCYTTFT